MLGNHGAALDGKRQIGVTFSEMNLRRESFRMSVQQVLRDTPRILNRKVRYAPLFTACREQYRMK